MQEKCQRRFSYGFLCALFDFFSITEGLPGSNPRCFAKNSFENRRKQICDFVIGRAQHSKKTERFQKAVSQTLQAAEAWVLYLLCNLQNVFIVFTPI